MFFLYKKQNQNYQVLQHIVGNPKMGITYNVQCMIMYRANAEKTNYYPIYTIYEIIGNIKTNLLD